MTAAVLTEAAVVGSPFRGSAHQASGARVLIQYHPENQAASKWAWELVESTNGKYYITDTGETLHLRKDCGMLWYSTNTVQDITHTLAYRVLTQPWSLNLRNPNGGIIWKVCEFCGPKLVKL